MKRRAQWAWCYTAYKLYLWLPIARTHKTPYGRFMLWLLGFGGAYAHSRDFRDFCDSVRF